MPRLIPLRSPEHGCFFFPPDISIPPRKVRGTRCGAGDVIAVLISSAAIVLVAAPIAMRLYG
jgi:hypothetical protein